MVATFSRVITRTGVPVAPVVTARTDADYREVVRRYLVPALAGQPAPRAIIETDRGTLVVDLLRNPQGDLLRGRSSRYRALRDRWSSR